MLNYQGNISVSQPVAFCAHPKYILNKKEEEEKTFVCLFWFFSTVADCASSVSWSLSRITFFATSHLLAIAVIHVRPLSRTGQHAPLDDIIIMGGSDGRKLSYVWRRNGHCPPNRMLDSVNIYSFGIIAPVYTNFITSRLISA